MLLSREVPRALELHVLDEVRQASLVVVFEHRPGLHDQPQLGLPRRLRVRPDVEAQAVRQAADQHFRIDRHVDRERVARDRCGRGFAAARDLRGR